MKYSEFYKLIESAGWTIKKGTNHYKYIHKYYRTTTVLKAVNCFLVVHLP